MELEAIGFFTGRLKMKEQMPVVEYTFLPARRKRKRGTRYGNVAGWLAGCLSHAGIVSKRLNLSLKNFFDHLIAPSNSGFF